MEQNLWQSQPKNQAHSAIATHVIAIERRQVKLFEKFPRLERLYDPNGTRGTDLNRSGAELGIVTENVIASNVDTVTAAIAATDVRARFMTDDASWSEQRKARHLEWYSEGLSKDHDVDRKCQAAFKGAALKGTGLIQVDVDEFDDLVVEQVPVDEIIVDESETHDGCPRQMHRRHWVDREELKAQYPGFAPDIENAQSSRAWRLNLGIRTGETNQVLQTQSWILPIGVKGKRGYVPGRFVKSIDGITLVDKKWHKPFFPFAKIVWSEPASGWYGISGAERIAGHQWALNKMNWQIDRQLDQWAVPTQFVRPIDANLTVKNVNRAGSIAVYKGEVPKTVMPQAVSPETYARRESIKSSSYEEFGVSRMAANSMKPAGLDSGVALREYRDQTTQRFAMQEKAFEKLKLDTVWLMLDRCKDLGKDAPTVMRRTKFGAKRIKWSDVDMGDVRIQMAAASTLARTPAGRMQTVLEWAQAGVISMDEARRLMQHPDLERAMSLYTAALENVEHCIEEIEDGAIVMPEPFMNLQMVVWRGQMRYLEDRDNGAPEEVLEALRQFVVQAAWIISQGANAAQDNAAMPAAGAAPAPDANVQSLPGGALPGGPPAAAAATAAFAPQAMSLKAS